MGTPPGHGFGHGSVTVLVTMPGLPPSQSITPGMAGNAGVPRVSSRSVTRHRSQEQSVRSGVWIWVPRFES